MQKSRAQKTEPTPGRILHRLYQTGIYEEMAEVQPEIKGPSNHELIKQILADKEVIEPVIQFINGKIDINTAMNEFNLKITPYMERYQCLEKTAEKLFGALALIIKDILKIKDDVTEKIEKVLEKDVPEKTTDLEIGESIKLKKGKSVRIKDAQQLQITIGREDSDKNHELNIVRNGDKLKVWCPTSDNEHGKEFFMEIDQGGEYSIGQANTLMLKRARAKLDKINSAIKKARRDYNHHRNISSVSRETEQALEKVIDLKRKAEILSEEIEELEADPRFKWFDKENSADISQDQIIIEFTEEGIIVVTDEGEKCKSTLMRWR